MSAEYKKAHESYRKLAEAVSSGNTDAKKDKIKAMNEIRSIERQSARSGEVLNARYEANGSITIEKTPAPTKRSLQEEHLRRYDNDAKVFVGGKEQTLREYHTERLRGR